MSYEITATSALNLLASTSTQIDIFSDNIIESVKRGEENPLKVLIQLKAFEKCSERINKEIKENYLNEADKFPGTSFEYLGNKVDKCDTSTIYDYTLCGDVQWNELAKELESIKEKIKARESFLKALKESITIVDESTGELFKVFPPTCKRTAGLKITIK